MADRDLEGVGHALVVGLGRSGGAAVAALAAHGVRVVATDENPDRRADVPDGVEVHLGTDGRAYLDGVDLVVPSPGVPEGAPVLRAALAAGVAIWSEPELGWRLAPRRVVGITGTNGKTSVTELTATMLTASGVDAVPCGNIGHPFTTAALESDPDRLLVAELSSFQLRFCHRLRPEVAVLLNLEPDHLDWHDDLGAYGAAKARIWQAQQEGDTAVVNADDPLATQLVRDHPPRLTAWFSGGGQHVPRGVDVHDGVLHAHLEQVDEPVLFPLDDLPLRAPHHDANVAAAACAALLAGGSRDGVAEAATAFRPGRHRLEHVITIGGVAFVDDSKATNVGAARAALKSFGSVVWIAGGRAKGADLSELAEHLGSVRWAVLIGEAAEELELVCERAGVHTTRATSMDEAVAAGFRAAQSGDTVLLAPACASFDMFEDYADRGQRFSAAATGLAREREEGT